jgi:hypothetical protein
MTLVTEMSNLNISSMYSQPEESVRGCIIIQPEVRYFEINEPKRQKMNEL